MAKILGKMHKSKVLGADTHSVSLISVFAAHIHCCFPVIRNTFLPIRKVF